MNIEDIRKLRHTFKFNNATLTDWFEVSEGKGYCSIRSGLSHADGYTKSPYNYNYFKGGVNATQSVLEHFNKWYKNEETQR